MPDVTIYIKPNCPYCAAAKEHYTKSGIPFKKVNVRESQESLQEMLSVSGGRRSVPVIVEDGKATIGFGGS